MSYDTAQYELCTQLNMSYVLYKYYMYKYNIIIRFTDQKNAESKEFLKEKNC